MKRTHILLLFAALAVSAFAAVKKPLVSSVEPPYWWTGMANDTLQLFIYAKAGHRKQKLHYFDCMG